MSIHNNLAQLRAKRGLGAAQLATAVDISRQTIYAIEAGTYVPNTVVSLKLARVLDTTVEELFQLETEQQAPAETAEVTVLGALETMEAGQPLRLCKVREHLIAVAPEGGALGLPPTDAILLAPVRGGKRQVNARVRIVSSGWNTPTRILLAGCDPSASILAGTLPRQECNLVIAYENSSRALELLQEGLVHVAGTHLAEKSEEKSLPQITKMFPRSSVAVFSYALWEEGLVVAMGNPKKIIGIADLARKDVRIINREPGAACRILLDELMAEHSIPVGKVNGYDRVARGQLPAARLVQSGEVDCCISTQASARVSGLDFVSLTQKPYRLVLRRKDLELAPMQSLIETLGRASFRREVTACVGYDMRTAGERLT